MRGSISVWQLRSMCRWKTSSWIECQKNLCQIIGRLVRQKPLRVVVAARRISGSSTFVWLISRAQKLNRLIFIRIIALERATR